MKMIWQANRYKHWKMPSSHSSCFTCLGMSCQINLWLANACDRDQKGYYDKPELWWSLSLFILHCGVSQSVGYDFIDFTFKFFWAFDFFKFFWVSIFLIFLGVLVLTQFK
jgi:hypothetical protein